jgi:membrane peptidoglycan carboxypeptidase
MTRLLQDVVDHGTGRAAALDDDSVAGKTGTSQDYRDAWFVGFNKALVVGVWVGNDDRSPMKGVTGGSLPAQIWRRFVSAATPLVDRLKDSAVGEVTSFSLPMTVKQVQCDQIRLRVRLLIVRSAHPIARTSPMPVSAGFAKRQFQKTPLKLSRAFRLPQPPVSAILTAVLDALDPSIP